eukprot:UN04725
MKLNQKKIMDTLKKKITKCEYTWKNRVISQYHQGTGFKSGIRYVDCMTSTLEENTKNKHKSKCVSATRVIYYYNYKEHCRNTDTAAYIKKLVGEYRTHIQGSIKGYEEKIIKSCLDDYEMEPQKKDCLIIRVNYPDDQMDGQRFNSGSMKQGNNNNLPTWASKFIDTIRVLLAETHKDTVLNNCIYFYEYKTGT